MHLPVSAYPTQLRSFAELVMPFQVEPFVASEDG
jgi:hypothetical protein